MSPPSTERQPLRIVVSGGIGSGKSSVSARLRDLGAILIEADLLGHEVLEPGGAAFAAVVARWPSVLVDDAISRSALAEIVFADLDQLQELEALTHPAIGAEIRRRFDAAASAPVVLELPLVSDLAGTGWIRVVVDADEETRVDRSVSRGNDEEDVRRRVAAQPPAEEWRRSADHVIQNDGTRAELVKAVDELWALLTSAEGARALGSRRPRR